ncbi:MAG: hypothetical protein QN423_12760 [Nitrososphaeraceae archaeon]|jgi:hypothetical protein|nr:hypothetical protein [Nitrososphaeraceae archaeon]
MKLTVSKYPVKKSRGYDFRPRGFIFLLAAILTAGFVAVSNGQSDRRYRQYVRQLFVNRLSQSIENVFFGDNEKLINQQ